MNPKYNSRKFIVSLFAILIILAISVYSIHKLVKSSDLTEIVTTGIMWIGITATTYIGGNTMANWTNSKLNVPREKQNTAENNSEYSSEP